MIMYAHCNQSPRLRCRPRALSEFWPPAACAGMHEVCFATGPSAPPPHPGTPAATHPAPAPSLRKM